MGIIVGLVSSIFGMVLLFSGAKPIDSMTNDQLSLVIIIIGGLIVLTIGCENMTIMDNQRRIMNHLGIPEKDEKKNKEG